MDIFYEIIFIDAHAYTILLDTRREHKHELRASVDMLRTRSDPSLFSNQLHQKMTSVELSSYPKAVNMYFLYELVEL